MDLDMHAHFPVPDSKPNPYLSAASPRAIPEMYDIPIGFVNRVLYDRNQNRSSERS